jgi:hypothetical protein
MYEQVFDFDGGGVILSPCLPGCFLIFPFLSPSLVSCCMGGGVAGLRVPVLFLCCSWLFFVTVVLLVVLWPSIHIAY